MKRLNLGSGHFPKQGYVNVDIDPRCNPDIVHNLEEFPYPFEDNTFDLIEADHVLEHLSNPFAVMKEIHRIAKPNALVIIRVPHFSRGFTHADHKRSFDITFPYYFNPTFQGGYTGVPFEIEKVRLRWFAQPYLKKSVLSPVAFQIANIAGKVIDFFANLSPMVCSRLWCFWVGGFEEVEFVFRVVKKK